MQTNDGSNIIRACDNDNDGYSIDTGDCDDNDPSVTPETTQTCQPYSGRVDIRNATDAEIFCSQGYSYADQIYLQSEMWMQHIDLSCLTDVGQFFTSCGVSPYSLDFSNRKQADSIVLECEFGGYGEEGFEEDSNRYVDFSALEKVNEIRFQGSYNMSYEFMFGSPDVTNVYIESVQNMSGDWPFVDAHIAQLSIYNLLDHSKYDYCSMVENVENYYLNFTGMEKFFRIYQYVLVGSRW